MIKENTFKAETEPYIGSEQLSFPFEDFKKDLNLPEINIKKEGKFEKFKNSIIYSLTRFTNDYTFENVKDKTLKIVSKKIIPFNSEKNIISEKFKEDALTSLKLTASQVGLSMSLTKKSLKDHALNSMGYLISYPSNIILKGNKRKIIKFQQTFGNILEAIGFDANDIYYETKKNDYISEDKIIENIEEELKEFKFYKENDKIMNDFLLNLNDESKLTTTYQILWPTVHKKIRENLLLLTKIKDFTKNDKYLKMVSDFAKVNGMESEDVSHILQNDDDAVDTIFKDKKRINKIKENLPQIKENIEKFSKLAISTQIRLSELVKVTDSMKDLISNLNVEPKRRKEAIEAIDKSEVLVDEKRNIYLYSQISKNVNTISKEHQRVKSLRP